MPSMLQYIIQGPTPTDPFEHVNGLEALVTRWIAATAPDHPVIVKHKGQSPKPYAISPLVAYGEGVCTFFLSLLDDGELAHLVCDGIRRTGDTIALGRDMFKLIEMPIVVMTETWDELLVRSVHAPETRWAFELVTPTATSGMVGYDKQCPVPTPEAYFSSWLHRWRACAPVRYHGVFDNMAILEQVGVGVAVSYFEGRTESVKIYKKSQRLPFIGYVGTVGFRALPGFCRDVPTDVLAALTALARLAPYCGTGKYTIRGMGQTQALSSP